MDEGNNFGAVNGGNGQPDNSLSNPNSFDQPTTAIMSSSDEQGGIPTISTEGASNSSKFFGSHARRSSRRIDSQQSDFLAAQNIASNPNNPQFFRDAAAENAATYIQPEAGRSKKPIIIGASLVIVAIVAVVATTVILSKSGGETPTEEPTVSMAELKKVFNKYANYLLAGEESEEDFDINEYTKNYHYFNPLIVYAERVIAEKEDGIEKNQYISTLENYYESFAESYKNSKFRSTPDDDLKDYFYGYALMPEINDDVIIKSYLEDKTITADSLFEKNFSYKASNKDLKQYLKIRKSLINVRLSILKSADKYGCVNDDKFDYDCATEHADDVANDNPSMENIDMGTLHGAILSLRESAMVELDSLYDSIYRVENEEEVKE